MQMLSKHQKHALWSDYTHARATHTHTPRGGKKHTRTHTHALWSDYATEHWRSAEWLHARATKKTHTHTHTHTVE